MEKHLYVAFTIVIVLATGAFSWAAYSITAAVFASDPGFIIGLLLPMDGILLMLLVSALCLCIAQPLMMVVYAALAVASWLVCSLVILLFRLCRIRKA